jgi:hypothetical protein
MHLVLGTLLPELAVNLEKLLLWIDLTLRGRRCPAFLRYPILNFVAWCTGPLWFSLLMVAFVFLLLVVTVISFGLILPFTLPLVRRTDAGSARAPRPSTRGFENSASPCRPGIRAMAGASEPLLSPPMLQLRDAAPEKMESRFEAPILSPSL